LKQNQQILTKCRLNLELDPRARESLEELQAKSKASSMADVIRRSLALYDMVLDHVKSGGSVVLKNNDGTLETVRFL
jgi:hypothetical protein